MYVVKAARVKVSAKPRRRFGKTTLVWRWSTDYISKVGRAMPLCMIDPGEADILRVSEWP